MCCLLRSCCSSRCCFHFSRVRWFTATYNAFFLRRCYTPDPLWDLGVPQMEKVSTSESRINGSNVYYNKYMSQRMQRKYRAGTGREKVTCSLYSVSHTSGPFASWARGLPQASVPHQRFDRRGRKRLGGGVTWLFACDIALCCRW